MNITTLLIITFLIFTYHFSPGQSTTDTTTTVLKSQQQIDSTDNTGNDDVDDDFSLFLFFMLIIGLIVIGAGVLLAVVILLILFGLIAAGLLSTSILIGVYKRSFTKGFKVFVISATIVGGIFVGTIGFWLSNKLFDWTTTRTALISGSLVGVVTGVLLGMLMFFVIQKVTGFLKEKLKTRAL